VALGRKNCSSPAAIPEASELRCSTRSFAAKLSGVEPEVYLRDVIACTGSHPVNRLYELLPWNIACEATRSVAA